MQVLEPARAAAEQLREETVAKSARIRELEAALAKVEQHGRDEAQRLRTALSAAESTVRGTQVPTLLTDARVAPNRLQMIDS